MDSEFPKQEVKGQERAGDIIERGYSNPIAINVPPHITNNNWVCICVYICVWYTQSINRGPNLYIYIYIYMQKASVTNSYPGG